MVLLFLAWDFFSAKSTTNRYILCNSSDVINENTNIVYHNPLLQTSTFEYFKKKKVLENMKYFLPIYFLTSKVFQFEHGIITDPRRFSIFYQKELYTARYLEFCETQSVYLNQKYIFITFSNHNLALETFFTSPNYPKCKFISTSGNLNL